jgi:peptidoglycan/LPS O-acetylase OafA/YrhL
VTFTSPLTERMPRLNALTGLRWWAAFLVFCYHIEVFAPFPGAISAVFAQGYLGVTFFFVLSGFVLTWSASARVSQSTFYWRRFARIYPSHFVALIFAIPVFYAILPGDHPSWVKPISVGALALSVVLLQGWSHTPSILFGGNPAAWTLSFEGFFYAVHPYVSKLLNPLSKRGALIFAVVTSGLAFTYRGLVLTFPDQWFAHVPLPPVRLTEFVLGMALAWAFRRGWRPRIPITVGIGAIAVVVASIALLPVLLPGETITFIVTGYGNELATVAFALAIVAIAQRALSGHNSHFASTVQVRLGEWSYAFYLVHATFIYIALTIFGPQASSYRNVGWFGLVLVFALAGAAALHHRVERPMEKRLRAWKDKDGLVAS